MRLVATAKSQQNQSAVDPWTLVHFSAGLAAGMVNAAFWPSMLAAIGYELLEAEVERSDVGRRLFSTSGPEHPVNMTMDVVVFGLGWYAGRAWNKRSKNSS